MFIMRKVYASLLIASAAAVFPLRGDPFWGATADGTARQFEITCGTCPNPITILSTQQDGGVGSSNAGVEFSHAGSASYFASAGLNGANALPTLHASAVSDVTIVTPSTFFFSASTDARGTQLYTYTGATPTVYAITYDVDGTIIGGPLTELSGGFTVFGSGFNPNAEVQPVLGFTFDHKNGIGATLIPVDLSGTVTFTVNPGDSFYVQATLTAITDSRSADMFASADASNTLAMQFTQGDTSLLTPGSAAASPVPEPAPIALLGIGLSSASVLGRRRRRD